ncbi:MAG: hypothetical protein ABI867_32705 [Kofleriaceae bacterium]
MADDAAIGAIDPTVEMGASELRIVVRVLLESGRVSIPVYAGRRMTQRSVTTPQIEAALRSGKLGTESCDAGTWRYRAARQGVSVIFTFDTDDEGNLLVVVTTWRNQ